MAILFNQSTAKTISLRPHHIFGRRKDRVDSTLEGMEISLLHASIRWEGSHWVLVDHSRNGTWIDGMRITNGDSVELKINSKITFGSKDNSDWKIVDLGPPQAVLTQLDDLGSVIELSNFHVLPSENLPLISLYKSEIGHWVCEEQNQTYTLEDGAIINVDQNHWQFFNGGEVDSTLDRIGMKILNVNDVHFKFDVSLDEEHTRVTVMYDGIGVDLGERVHHYLLLVLARQKLQDSKNGLDSSSQGWIEMNALCSMLRMDQAHINIQIYRARKQALDSLKNILHLPQIVERRAGSLRFGFTQFQIVRGSNVEGVSISESIEE